MMIKKILFIVASIIVVGFFVILTFNILENQSSMTEQEAISAIKKIYPELSDYPSDNLPPRSISTEVTKDGWYIGFIQNGSGRPILSARCFYIQENGVIWEKQFEPKSDDNSTEFSVKTCSTIDDIDTNSNSANVNNPQICEIENCHGLDMVCGSRPPDFCTSIYELGDKCREFANCDFVEDQCTFIESAEFVDCKDCVELCIQQNPNDPESQFQCENECGVK